ncbi:glycosyltransferase [Phenylobacterium sp.]|uniref:glycosyltransferase n=1 Tax=Phenylobacterium sp. TaxID=1871053 RepID=UPI00391A2B22
MSAADGRARPRVLYLINAFEAGGAEAGLVRLVRGGLFDGFDLTVAGLAAGEPEVRAALERAGVEPLTLTAAHKPRVRDLPRLFAGIVRLTRRLRPDVVILSLPQANLLGRLTSLVWRPPVVVSFEHNVRLAKRTYEVLFWLTSPLVDWMFADAGATAREAARRFYIRPPGRTSVVPLVSLPDTEAAAALTPDRFTVVNAARFTPAKNQAALIRAVAILRDRGIDVDLVLYGQGPERDACEALAASLGVADRVRLPGFVPDWPKRPASAFVLASRHEGLCMALLEAMHAGLPVATPLVGGVADYATPETALILSGAEPTTLAAAIAALRDDPHAAARAQTARARVRGTYGETAVAARLRAVNAELHAAVRAFPSPPAPIRR